MTFFLSTVTCITVAFILLLGSLIVKARILPTQKWISIGFLVSITSYLLIDLFSPYPQTIGGCILLVFTLALPYLFWLYVKAIFSDDFLLERQYIWFFFGFIGVHFFFILIRINKTHFSETAITVGEMFSRSLSMLLVVLGLWEVARRKALDLVPARMQYRQVLTLVIALTIGLTILTELVFIEKPIPVFLVVWQRLAILTLIVYTLYRHIEFKNEFYLSASNKPGGVIKEEIDVELLRALTEKMKEGIWREESLTIQKLSEMMGVKEYRLRKTINMNMGYRNFNEFLNRYRIEEAQKLLFEKDKSELNIQEVAYQLGYTSLSTFNKAFKENTGMTPTEWRKKGKKDES